MLAKRLWKNMVVVVILCAGDWVFSPELDCPWWIPANQLLWGNNIHRPLLRCWRTSSSSHERRRCWWELYCDLSTSVYLRSREHCNSYVCCIMEVGAVLDLELVQVLGVRRDQWKVGSANSLRVCWPTILIARRPSLSNLNLWKKTSVWCASSHHHSGLASVRGSTSKLGERINFGVALCCW